MRECEKRIPSSNEEKTVHLEENMKHEVREVIYQMYEKKEDITLKSLQRNLREKQLLEASTGSLSILLKEIGFKFKKSCNRRALCEMKDVRMKRVFFLRKFMNNKTSPNPKKCVFLDETWIFARGANKRTWQDDSVKSVKNTNSEGKRFMILHAGNEDGFISESGLIFSTKSKSADYHDNMNSENFEKWFMELLPKLEEPSIIVLDNAPYHSRVSEQHPTSRWKKNELQEWLRLKNIEFDKTSTHVELLSLCKEQVRKKEYVVDTMALQYGHEVLRLPPYHCQYNPIEMVWGIAKNYYDRHIGRDGFGDENVLAMWKEALETVTAETWSKCVRKTERLIEENFSREILFDCDPLIINTNDSSDSEDDEL